VQAPWLQNLPLQQGNTAQQPAEQVRWQGAFPGRGGLDQPYQHVGTRIRAAGDRADPVLDGAQDFVVVRFPGDDHDPAESLVVHRGKQLRHRDIEAIGD
jgi:hypothetical protein